MESKLIPLLTYLGLAMFFLGVTPCAGGCNYSAIFSFGDSLTDTGNAIKTNPIFFTSTGLPYGETYFKRGAHRFSDGRLVIDFLATSVGLPFLNPYLAYKQAGTDFSNGVNYAVAGGTVQGAGTVIVNGGANILTVDNLQVQLGWHLRIKSLSDSLVVSPDLKLPSPESFSQGLYFFSIGGNDYGSIFLRQSLVSKRSITNTEQLELVPVVVGKLTAAIETLYANEARNFFIVNISPEGCVPLYLKLLNGTLDEFGCLEQVNQVDFVHNQQLMESLEGLKQKYSDINFIFADFYSAYTKALMNPSAYGFQETTSACCGGGPKVKYGFQLTRICSKFSYLCPDPNVYVIWDGVHPTEAFNRYTINQFVSGVEISPPNSFSCATLV